jgi:hypothetical protein
VMAFPRPSLHIFRCTLVAGLDLDRPEAAVDQIGVGSCASCSRFGSFVMKVAASCKVIPQRIMVSSHAAPALRTTGAG